MPLEWLKWARWVWGLCAIAGGVFLFVISGMGKVRPEPFNYTGIFLIPFTNFSVLMGMMAVFSIGWDNPKKKRNIVLGTLALCAVICGLYASQTRASWIIALILLVLAGLFFRKGNKKTIVVTSSIVLLLSALIVAFMFSGQVPGRFKQVQSDVMQYQKGDANTSIGARLQLWEASWKAFTKHPVTGIGERSKSFQKNMAKTGVNFAPEAARQPHAHNEFLQRAVRYGALGGIAVIAVFLVPFIYFVSYIRSSDSVLRTTAFMGATYNLAFFIFGLSDVIFEWRTTIQFYVVMSSMLFAALIKRKEEVLFYSI
ncbi:MAG: O-antigen ligase family protein [Oxalobacter formigenes]|nr:O-antigen ligase family protein [Oxalobacter formigenes]